MTAPARPEPDSRILPRPTSRAASCLSLGLLAAIFAGISPAMAQEPDATPPDLGAELAAAEKLLAAGRADQAREKLAALRDAGIEDAVALRMLGEAELELALPDDAVATLLAANRLAGDEARTLLALGKALLAQARAAVAEGDYEKAGFAYTDATSFLEEAAAREPQSGVALLLAAESERERGDPATALVFAERALERAPEDPETLLKVGTLRYFATGAVIQSGDLDGAKAARQRTREAFDRVIALDREGGFHGRAWNGLGWVALQAGELDSAAEAFKKSLIADPLLDDSYRQWLAIRNDTKENRTAMVKQLDEVVAAARKSKPTERQRRATAVALYYRGKVKGALRDRAGLIADLKEAVNLDATLSSYAATQIALAQYSAGEYDAAADHLLGHAKGDVEGVVAAVNGDSSPRDVLVALRGLADKMVGANRVEAARDLFEIIANASQNSADDWNNYALFCRDTMRYEESYAAYERALELRPDDPGLLNDTALILQYHLDRDLERAIELYDRAIVEGQRVLADDGQDSFAKEIARVAVRDATNNSRMLRARLGG
jgi:tetratricopeptide (TPR) repeat protein